MYSKANTMNRAKQIAEIKRIISEFGETTTSELELESSPCINSIGNGKNNVCQLAERFTSKGVEAITYHDDIELGSEFIPYEKLKSDIVKEIYNIALEYETTQTTNQ